MGNRRFFGICVILVLCLGSSTMSITITWDGSFDDYWCNSLNWTPEVLPGSGDTATISGEFDRGPIYNSNGGCSPIDVFLIDGPAAASGYTQVVDVCDNVVLTAAVGETVKGVGWVWRDGLGTSVINFAGTPTVTIGGQRMRGPDQGEGEVNISGDPNIIVQYDFRGADQASAYFTVNISSGKLEVQDDFVIGDNGGGELNISGGRLLVGDSFDMGGVRGTAPVTLNMTGGLIWVGGNYFLPSNPDRQNSTEVHLDGGAIHCENLTHGGADGGQDDPPYTNSGYADKFLMDLSGGELRVRGNVGARIDANVASGNIIAYEREGTVVWSVIDGNTVVVGVPPGTKRAIKPRPTDLEVKVDPNTVLTWQPGQDADTHHIYLGTDFNDVNDADTNSDVYIGSQDTNSYDPCGLELMTTYYWRIDEEIEVPPLVTKGRTWQFTTRSNPIDPNMMLYYKFDETSGNTASDSSGYGNHATISTADVVPPYWEPNDGQFGGALAFSAGVNHETGVWPPTDVLDSINGKVSIAVWLKDAYYQGGDNWVCDSGGGQGAPYHMYVALPTSDKEVEWRAGNDSNDTLRWDLGGRYPQELEDWHFWAFVKDEAADTMSIYFDGIEEATKSGVFDTLVNISGTPFIIGATTWLNYGYVGSMDDFRLYDRALTATQVAELFRGGDIGKAWGPDPFDKQTDVPRDVSLSWLEGAYAVQHDVYFGTDFNDVNDATTVTAQIYKGRQDPCEYVLTANLELNTTYYWRVDEINDSDGNSPWKGNVWEFTVANFLFVDDMESYDPFVNKIWFEWANPWGSGSFVELGSSPFTPVHDGAQSMEYTYDSTIKWDFFSYWSEVQYDFDTPQDWPAASVKALALFFYGDPDNDIGATEQFSIGVEGTSRVDLDFPDMNELLLDEWQDWNIDLSEFAAATLTAINTVYLKFGDSSNTDTPGGSGIVYFDDLRLYPPRCVPELGPVADLSGNCIVEFADVGIMGDAWLKADAQLSVVPPSPGPVGWWKLDGNADDSSGNSYDGMASGGHKWVSGYIDGAIQFTGGKVLVPDDGNTPLLRPAAQVSATAWAKPDETPGYAARVLAKGVDTGNLENYAIQASSHASWYIRDANTTIRAASSSSELTVDEWAHLAGTYDGSDVSFYVNGQLEGTNVIGAVTILQDSNDLAFGDAVDVPRAFPGAVDDVRIYGYGLSAEQVAYIATQSTGGAGTGYMPVLSSANIYDSEPQGQRSVNFKDYALLMQSWLEEQLWP